jgi:amino acid permease
VGVLFFLIIFLKSFGGLKNYTIFVSQTTRDILKFVGKLTPGVVSRRNTAVSVLGLNSSNRTEKLKGWDYSHPFCIYII